MFFNSPLQTEVCPRLSLKAVRHPKCYAIGAVNGYRHVMDCLVPGTKNAEAFAESTALTLGASGKFLGSSSACSSQKNALS